MSNLGALRFILGLVLMGLFATVALHSFIKKQGNVGRTLSDNTESLHKFQDRNLSKTHFNKSSSMALIHQNNTPEHRKDADLTEPRKYLVFLSHSGYSNQLLGLERAAKLAYLTGRVLVLPPIVPHISQVKYIRHHSTEETDYSVFTSALGVGYGENYCSRKQLFLNVLKTQGDLLALDAKNNVRDVPYVSHSELMDIKAISNATGVELIDFPDFMHGPSFKTTETWSFGKDPLLDLTGDCEGKKTNTSEVLTRFEQNFGNARIAAIDSAFKIARRVSVGKQLDKVFEDSFEVYPLSSKVECLVVHLRSKLPKVYLGLHIRFEDNLDLGVACNNTNATSLLDKALGPHLSKREKEQDGKSTTTAFVGLSNRRAKLCFQKYVEHANITFTAVTVNDLLSDDHDAQALMSRIPVEKPTVLLVLDQVMLSLSDETLFAKYMPGASTYQNLIMARQQEKPNHDWEERSKSCQKIAFSQTG